MVYVFAGTTEQEVKLMEADKFSKWRWVDVQNIPEAFLNKSVADLIKHHREGS